MVLRDEEGKPIFQRRYGTDPTKTSTGLTQPTLTPKRKTPSRPTVTEKTLIQKRLAQARTPEQKGYYLEQLRKRRERRTTTEEVAEITSTEEGPLYAEGEVPKGTMGPYITGTKVVEPRANDPKRIQEYIDNLDKNIETVQQSTTKIFRIDGKEVTKEQLLNDLIEARDNFQAVLEPLQKLQNTVNALETIKYNGKSADAYITDDGQLQVVKPPGMPDEVWEVEKTSKFPEDSKFTINITKDGKTETKEVSKSEILAYLRDQREAYYLAQAYEGWEKEKPFSYWINTLGWAIQQPFKAGAQAVGELRGELTAQDRYALQGDFAYQFGKTYGKTGVDLTWSVLNPIDGLYAPYIRAFIVAPLAGFALGRLGSRGLGWAMGRAPLTANIASRTIASATTGALLGAGVGKYINYAETKNPFERREQLASLMEFGTTAYMGYRGYKAGMTTPYAFGKSKGLTPYEKYYQKGYTGRMKSLAKTKYRIYKEPYQPSVEMRYKGGKWQPVEKVTLRQKIGQYKFKKYSKLSPWKSKRMIEFSKYRLQLEQGFRGMDTRAYQEYASRDMLSKVETLSGKPSAKKYFGRRITSKKAEVFGGATYKPETHDLDVMYKQYWRQQPLDRYAMEQQGYRLEDIADIKVAQKPGEIVSTAGTVKLEPYTIRGVRQMRLTEQASRLSSSSLELAHGGRIKDIMKSSELYGELYQMSPLKTQIKLAKPIVQYQKLAPDIIQDPFMMNPLTSKIIYGPNLRDLANELVAEGYYKFRKPTLEARYREIYPMKEQISDVAMYGKTIPTIKVRPSKVIGMKSIKPSVSTSVTKFVPSKSISPSPSSVSVFPSSSISKSSKSSASTSSSLSKSSSSVSSSTSSSSSTAPATTVFGFLLPFEEEKKKKGKGYHVYTQDPITRKYKKITQSPLEEKYALGLGADRVDKTQSVRFKIKKTKGSPSKPITYQKRWNEIKYKFTKRDSTYYEKKQYQKDFDIERGEYVAQKPQKPIKKPKSNFFGIIPRGRKK